MVPVSFSHAVGYTSGLTSSFHVSPSLFLSSHPRDFDKCEMLVKDLYSKLGLEYRESSSEETNLRELVDEKLSVIWQSVLAAQDTNCVLSCMKRSVTSRSSEMILPFYSAPMEYSI